MKKKGLFFCALLLIFPMCLFAGCNKDWEEGDFSVKNYRDGVVVTQILIESREKPVLIVPYESSGKPVLKLGTSSIVAGHIPLQSQNLEVLYTPYSLEVMEWRIFGGGENPKLQKVLIASNAVPDARISFDEGHMTHGQIKVIVTSKIYQEKYASSESGVLVFLPANVSFNFNYESSPNDGYYFIDYIEETGKIINPPEPKRSGYSFAGWYKDAACTQKWDFATDEKAVEADEEGEIIFAETVLYAKWM